MEFKFTCGIYFFTQAFCCFLHKWVCKNISQIKCSLHWIVHQNGISCRTGNEFWDHIPDLISGFESADRNVVKNDHDYEFFIIVTVICLRLWCRLSIKQSWNCVNENPSIYVTCGRNQRLNFERYAPYNRRITRHWKYLHLAVTFIGIHPITESSIT